MDVWAVVFYEPTGSARATPKVSALFTEMSAAEDKQLELCGGCITERGEWVVGENGVISWIIKLPLNEPINWTLSVLGPGH